ncbi:MAG: hypothetical protein MI861_04405, partial [Pirellulales bacterium]|nr:hypothetical protein [Pirellulales bacterium]
VDYDYDRNGRLVKLVQPIDVGLDQVSDFRYDAFDNLIASSVTNVVLDVVETPQNESDTQILTNYYAYDAIGRVTAVAAANPDLPAGGENTIDDYGVQGPQFSRAGLPASWDNRAITLYTYDGNSNVTQTSTYDGGNDRVTTLEYDKLDRLIKLTQPQVTAYDSDYTPGSPIPTAGSVTPTTLFLYDNLGNLKGVHDPLGNETFFHYDQWNRQIASIANPRDSQFTVSDRSSLLGDTAFTGFSTDPVTGATISHTDYAPVDVAAGLQEDTNGDQVLERIGIHSWQITHTDPLQNVTEVTTDFLGRTVQTSRHGEGTELVTRWRYDNDHQPLSVTDAENNTTEFTYNGLNLIESIIQPAVNIGVGNLTSHPTTSYQYDAGRRMIAMTDPINRTTTFEHNLVGQTTLITPPVPGPGEAAPTVRYTYDALGNTISHRDGQGNIETYAYDRLLRPVTSTDAAGNQTTRQYDLLGNLTSLTDPNGNTTTWTYDDLDRVLTDTNQLGKTRAYQYDQASNLRHVNDRNGRDILYNYDHNYRLQDEHWVQPGGSPLRHFQYSFDLVGNLLSADDVGKIANVYQYDDFYRVITEQQDYSVGSLIDAELTRTYDLVHNLTSTTISPVNHVGAASPTAVASSHTNNYTYDDLYRLTQVTQSGSGAAFKQADFQYDLASQLLQIDRGSGAAVADVRTLYDWDQAGRLVGISHLDPAVNNSQLWTGHSDTTTTGILAAYRLDYDAANRLEHFDSQADDLRVSYNYDVRDQLTGQTYLTGAGATHPLFASSNQTLSYDDNGNRESSPGVSLSADGQNNQ